MSQSESTPDEDTSFGVWLTVRSPLPLRSLTWLVLLGTLAVIVAYFVFAVRGNTVAEVYAYGLSIYGCVLALYGLRDMMQKTADQARALDHKHKDT
jgi:hypothetical protein